MKKPKLPKKQNIKNGVATGVSFLCGDAHFVFKSLADGAVRTEASLVHRLTGKAKVAIIEDRHNRTEATQDLWKASPGLLKKALKNTFSPSTVQNKDGVTVTD